MNDKVENVGSEPETNLNAGGASVPASLNSESPLHSALRTPHSALVPESAIETDCLNLRPYQSAVFCDHQSGIVVLHWARQTGKSYTLAAWAVFRITRHAGRLVTVLSNSRENGAEFLRKCAEICRLFRRYDAETVVGKPNKREFEDYKLELRLTHDDGSVSRIKVLAASPRTARGFSGDLILDEFAFHEDSAAIWSAAEPILSSNPDYLCRIASTGNGHHNMFYRMATSAQPHVSMKLVEQAAANADDTQNPPNERGARPPRAQLDAPSRPTSEDAIQPDAESNTTKHDPLSPSSPSSPSAPPETPDPYFEAMEKILQERLARGDYISDEHVRHRAFPNSRPQRVYRGIMSTEYYEKCRAEDERAERERRRRRKAIDVSNVPEHVIDKTAYVEQLEAAKKAALIPKRIPISPQSSILYPPSSIRLSRLTRTDAHRLGLQIYDPGTRQPITPAQARAQALDKRAYDQNYECTFADENITLLTHELISAAERDDVGYICEQNWSRETLEFLRACNNHLFVGFDVARKGDLSVITVVELICGAFYVRAILRIRDMRLPEQELRLGEICKMPQFKRAAIDMTGLGCGLCEYAQNHFDRYRIQGVNFATMVPANKEAAAEGRVGEKIRITEAMAIQLLRVYEDRRIQHPRDDILHDDLRKPEKITSPGGRVSIAATRDEAGHADHFWSFALAIEAGSQPPSNGCAMEVIDTRRKGFICF